MFIRDNMKKFIILLIMFSTVLNCMGQQWISPNNRDVKTIFFQGIFASGYAQAAKYTKKILMFDSGDLITCKNAPDIICDPYIGKELDEVVYKQSFEDQGLIAQFLSYLRKVYQLGTLIQENVSQAKNDTWEICFDGSGDKIPTSFSIDWKKCCFGQKGDVDEHRLKYAQCIQKFPDSDIILYGSSRGAATTFNAAAVNDYDMNKIKLIVLESCYDSIPLLMQAKNSRLSPDSTLSSMLQTLLSLCTGYKKDGFSPIELVDTFPRDVPVVFVTSEKDITVPSSCTQNIAQALVQRGRNLVYLLKLKNSSHPQYTLEDKEDIKTYLCTMHALYKHLNLPFIHEYAQKGEQHCLLEKSRLA